MKKNNFSSKINQLVLRGLLTEDQELFLQRLDVILSRNDETLLEQLAEGVILNVKVVDNEAAIKYVQERNKCNNWEITEITRLEVTADNRVRVYYNYLGKTRWFATQEQADRFAQGYSVSGSENQDEEHQFMGRYSSSSSDIVDIKDWMEVEML
jgi:formate dehydrogenase assembly factor FdhD